MFGITNMSIKISRKRPKRVGDDNGTTTMRTKNYCLKEMY